MSQQKLEKKMKVLTKKEVKQVSGGVIEGEDGKGCTDHHIKLLGGNKNTGLSL